MWTIGVDVGGMSVKVGLVDEQGKIVCKNRLNTEKTPEQTMQNIVNQINDLLKLKNISIKDIKGIGIGSPGTISSKEGKVIFWSNLNWKDVCIVDFLKQHFETEIKISNDANVAALGEKVYGCAKQYKNAIMITLGTGVGGGIIIDGKLFEGVDSLGGEIGHICLNSNGIKCSCGRRGCLEVYASATALIKQTKTAMRRNKQSLMWKYVGNKITNVDGKTAFECAKQGDETAIKVCDKFIEYLSDGIMSLLNIFRSEVIIIGGGISAQGKYLRERIINRCRQFDYGYPKSKPSEILIATLGNDAGIIGAAALLNQ